MNPDVGTDGETGAASFDHVSVGACDVLIEDAIRNFDVIAVVTEDARAVILPAVHYRESVDYDVFAAADHDDGISVIAVYDGDVGVGIAGSAACGVAAEQSDVAVNLQVFPIDRCGHVDDRIGSRGCQGPFDALFGRAPA